MGSALARRDLTETELTAIEKRAARLANAANTDLVPKSLRGKPADVFLVVSAGARWGLEPVESFGLFHVLDGGVQPSVQFRVSLSTAYGHEVRLVKYDDDEVIVKGRRREDRHDPDAWVEFRWTVEKARKAHLLDMWVERWTKVDGRNRKETYVVGDDRGVDEARVKAAPEWAQKEYAAGKVKVRDNWHAYTADMLYARAAGRLCKLLFGDTLLGLPPMPDSDEALDVLATVEAEIPHADHPEGDGGGGAEDEDIADIEVVGETQDSHTEGGGDDGPPDAGTPSEAAASMEGEVPRQTNVGDDGPEPPPATDAGSAEGTAAAADPSASGTPSPKWCAEIHRFAGQVFADDPAGTRALKVHAIVLVVTGGRTASTKELEDQLEANRVVRRLRDVQQGAITVEETDGQVLVRQGDDVIVFDVTDDGLAMVAADEPARKSA